MRIIEEIPDPNPHLFDPSEAYRTQQAKSGDEAAPTGIPVLDKLVRQFRRFSIDFANPIQERVRKTYLQMHTFQTVSYVKSARKRWLKFDHLEASVMQALEMLNDLVDESDPDLNLPNIVHAFQTAEKIREDHPDEDWFHLVGLVHDLGKIMAFYEEPQWAVVGDTYPVGCKPQKSVVYWSTSFEHNPDLDNPKYNSDYGMYQPNCGLDDLTMTWGHDEYLYQVLVNHGTTLPEAGLWMIRYHSFYPWHTGGDYRHLANDADDQKLDWVKKFNKYDLYTKCPVTPDVDNLKDYYQGLIDKYIPGQVKF